MRDRLEALRRDGLAAVSEAMDLDTLHGVESSLLGRSGKLTAELKGLGKLSKEERPLAGKFANEVKQDLQDGIETRRAHVSVGPKAYTHEPKPCSSGKNRGAQVAETSAETCQLLHISYCTIEGRTAMHRHVVMVGLSVKSSEF